MLLLKLIVFSTIRFIIVKELHYGKCRRDFGVIGVFIGVPTFVFFMISTSKIDKLKNKILEYFKSRVQVKLV
jgi:hypothetical protein